MLVSPCPSVLVEQILIKFVIEDLVDIFKSKNISKQTVSGS